MKNAGLTGAVVSSGFEVRDSGFCFFTAIVSCRVLFFSPPFVRYSSASFVTHFVLPPPWSHLRATFGPRRRRINVLAKHFYDDVLKEAGMYEPGIWASHAMPTRRSSAHLAAMPLSQKLIRNYARDVCKEQVFA